MKNTLILIGLVLLGVVAAGIYKFNIAQDDIYVKQPNGQVIKYNDLPKEDKMMKEETMKKDESMMKPEMVKEAMPSDDMMKDDKMMKEETMKKDESMMKEESMTQPEMKKDAMMMKATGYMNYDEGKVKEALANGQKVALFFHASWCPSCRALDGAINSSLSSIPADALIVKVDYDTSTEMKKKYGVTSQHTIVLIDKDMTLISKKTGARSVSDVLN